MVKVVFNEVGYNELKIFLKDNEKMEYKDDDKDNDIQVDVTVSPDGWVVICYQVFNTKINRFITQSVRSMNKDIVAYIFAE